jgi:deoxyribodipyrimidine photo-lyase
MTSVELAGQLPNPQRGRETDWVRQHLGDLCCDGDGEAVASPRFRGTQDAANAAWTHFDVSGYAARRNEVLPVTKRGASGLSPYIRYGLLTLPELWSTVAGPSRDVTKFRDELLWQEYARHMYARLGSDTSEPIRCNPRGTSHSNAPHHTTNPWDRNMACVDLAIGELEDTGWMVNQTRMWMASHWNVRHGANWREGEEYFFQHLLDGSRAANRLGWQWTIGAGTGKAYGFSRSQVENRAPGLCDGCAKRNACPIEKWPTTPTLHDAPFNPLLRRENNVERVAGPATPEMSQRAEAVWLTAESMGEKDPALSSNPDLPVVFVFDEPLLARLQLSAKRLIFLTERLAELAEIRTLTISRGSPTTVLRAIRLAATFTPVPGWHVRQRALNVVALYPWPWLRYPTPGTLASFSAWNKL